MARLKKEIGIAAMWYIIGIKLQSLGATPARQQATFVNLYDKAAALLAAIKAFPPELPPVARSLDPMNKTRLTRYAERPGDVAKFIAKEKPGSRPLQS